ncbi:MAG: glycerol kinase, partial [Verrucomicrobiales bacterium]
VRPAVSETTALGAAYLAGLAVGYWKHRDDIATNWQEAKRFEPAMNDETRGRLVHGWNKAVKAAKGWAE